MQFSYRFSIWQTLLSIVIIRLNLPDKDDFINAFIQLEDIFSYAYFAYYIHTACALSIFPFGNFLVSDRYLRYGYLFGYFSLPQTFNLCTLFSWRIVDM